MTFSWKRAVCVIPVQRKTDLNSELNISVGQSGNTEAHTFISSLSGFLGEYDTGNYRKGMRRWRRILEKWDIVVLEGPNSH